VNRPELDDNRYRARIPQAVASNYQIAPRATILNVEKRKVNIFNKVFFFLKKVNK